MGPPLFDNRPSFGQELSVPRGTEFLVAVMRLFDPLSWGLVDEDENTSEKLAKVSPADVLRAKIELFIVIGCRLYNPDVSEKLLLKAMVLLVTVVDR